MGNPSMATLCWFAVLHVFRACVMKPAWLLRMPESISCPRKTGFLVKPGMTIGVRDGADTP